MKQVNRRQALTSLGTVSLAALLAACTKKRGTVAVPTASGTTASVSPQPAVATLTSDLFEASATCALAPELTEGPYYFDVDSIRSDIREDREGAPLRLGIRVRNASDCKPLTNSIVDVWHCDATGLYSGFESASSGGSGGGGGPGGGGPGGGNSRSDQKTYLRGAQATNTDGIAEFLTVYPGWYRGRTTHIHAKVHLNNKEIITTQFFFDEDFTKTVYAKEPYADDEGRDTFNSDDNIFSDKLLLSTSLRGEENVGLITVDVEA